MKLGTVFNGLFFGFMFKKYWFVNAIVVFMVRTIASGLFRLTKLFS
jgi:hypothetical protein